MRSCISDMYRLVARSNTIQMLARGRTCDIGRCTLEIPGDDVFGYTYFIESAADAMLMHRYCMYDACVENHLATYTSSLIQYYYCSASCPCVCLLPYLVHYL